MSSSFFEFLNIKNYDTFINSIDNRKEYIGSGKLGTVSILYIYIYIFIYFFLFY